MNDGLFVATKSDIAIHLTCGKVLQVAEDHGLVEFLINSHVLPYKMNHV